MTETSRQTVPVVITGVGPISAIGCGRDAFWNALIAGQHGFADITLCNASNSLSTIAAEVKINPAMWRVSLKFLYALFMQPS